MPFLLLMVRQPQQSTARSRAASSRHFNFTHCEPADDMRNFVETCPRLMRCYVITYMLHWLLVMESMYGMSLVLLLPRAQLSSIELN
jgi:hypothetical protein